MSQVGYARVSSTGQSLDVQLSKLNHCDKIFSEKKSATTTNGRTALKECLSYLREGDQLVITRLDRLARSVMDLSQITYDLQQRNIDLVVIDQQIDTSTPTGKLMFNMLGAIAEFETELRKERQVDGITKALEKGVKFGAKAKLTDEQVQQMKLERSDGVLIRELCANYGLSKASVYRILGAQTVR
ncbi:MAG: recombinase family protein [Gallionella sp.]|nr:recombinase family protein [Methylobacter sp.]MDP2428389.1 recombinase family protein [Methylobacter sp.]MDP3053077.1 recombinase family protein [Methylobacter sp.]MDP3360707.1 recombinase family protein [Methylobacter sp.]MDZ4200635.1 recombinase family protein [Gallionella sp.]